MFSPTSRMPAAVLSLASALLMGLPASAQGLINGTVNANGDLFDCNGNLVGHCSHMSLGGAPIVVPGATLMQVAPADTTVIRTQEVLPGPGSVTTIKKTVTTTSDDGSPISTTTVRTYDMGTVLGSVLDGRRLTMERQMGNSVLPEVIQMRADLAQIGASELAARNSGILDYASTLRLAARLDEINNRFFDVTGIGRLPPLVIFDSSGNRQIAVTNVTLY